MMGPGEAIIALIIIGFPVIALTFLFSRWFKLKERKLELEARVRVLEKIVTDGGFETAAQIEALRSSPALPKSASSVPQGDKVP